MKPSAIIAAFTAAGLIAIHAGADPGDGRHTIVVRPMSLSVNLDAGEQVEIDWVMGNLSGHAITVHGLSSDRAERITLQRRRRLFGRDFYQNVRFLRLEAEELARLKSPDHVLRVQGLRETDATIVVITLDLGPDGESSFALFETEKFRARAEAEPE